VECRSKYSLTHLLRKYIQIISTFFIKKILYFNNIILLTSIKWVQNTVKSAGSYPCYKKNPTDTNITRVFNQRTATTAKDELRPRRQGGGVQHRGGFPRLLLPRHGRVAPRQQRPLRRTLRHAARGQQLPAPHGDTIPRRAPPQASACRRLLLRALPAGRRL